MISDAFNEFLRTRLQPPLNPAFCYKAFIERDKAFDGVFFVAVRTTKIYCRPTCSARKANFENCMFYSSADLAEKKGYRPCLRCHPAFAPEQSADPLVRLATDALEKIYRGALIDSSVDEFAAEMKVSTRHLRRALQKIYQKTPSEIATDYKLALAEELLSDLTFRVPDVASRSGFSSVRRFNEVFLAKHKMSPTEWRKSVGKNAK